MAETQPKPAKTPTVRPVKFIEIRTYLAERYQFRFNTVAVDLEYTEKGANEWQPLNPSNLTCELFESGFQGFDKQLDAMLRSDFVPKFDPIRQYFEGLPEWDGTDYIGQLMSHIKTSDQDFFIAQFKKMLVRMIAQSFNRIAFNKHCLTLYSKQNDGKTSFFEYLINDTPLERYYKKNPDIEGKEAKRALAENFLLNLDELSALSKTDVNRVKATFSESAIKVRLPYDKKDSIMPRRASFVGSTNKREFLVDETGNVRWLVFEVISINHNYGRPGGYADVDINKVWAQAFSLFQTNSPVNLSADEIAHSEKNNEQYGQRTPEYQMLLQWFTPAPKAQGGTFYQPVNIVQRLTELSDNKIRLTSENVGRALTKMGIERSANRIGKNVAYGYWLKELLLGVDGQPTEPVTVKF